MKTSGAIRAQYGHQNKYSLLPRTEIEEIIVIARLSNVYITNAIFHPNTTFTFD